MHYDGKSRIGVNLSLRRSIVYVHSSKQKIVTKSSTENELFGLQGTSLLVFIMSPDDASRITSDSYLLFLRVHQVHAEFEFT